MTRRIKDAARKCSATDWLMVFFTSLICLTTAIYTYYARKQWAEMHTSGADTHSLAIAAKAQADAAQSQVEKMKESLDKTDELAIAAKRSADYSEKALKVAEQEARVSQRAWIAVEVHGLLTPSACKVQIAFMNQGRTPAVNVRYLENIDYGFRTPPISALPERKADPTFPIPPNGAFTEELPIDFCIKGGMKTLNARDFRAVLHGIVWYNDIFHHRHWAEFMYNYYGSGSVHIFSVGGTGNKFDEDPE